jgi:hypothetical protein
MHLTMHYMQSIILHFDIMQCEILTVIKHITERNIST